MAYIQMVTSTWTPTIAFGGASVGVTYSTQTGLYTIIGDFIYYQFEIVLTSKGSSTGNATVSNFPFAFPTGVNPVTLLQTNINTGTARSYTTMGGATTSKALQFTPLASFSSNNLTNTNFAGTESIFGTIVGNL